MLFLLQLMCFLINFPSFLVRIIRCYSGLFKFICNNLCSYVAKYFSTHFGSHFYLRGRRKNDRMGLLGYVFVHGWWHLNRYLRFCICDQVKIIWKFQLPLTILADVNKWKSMNISYQSVYLVAVT